jgi:hypothetical protein
MLLLKYLLLFTGAGLLGGAFAMVVYDIYWTRQSWRADSPELPTTPIMIRWRGAGRVALLSVARCCSA